jgi:hypothetical protein
VKQSLKVLLGVGTVTRRRALAAGLGVLLMWAFGAFGQARHAFASAPERYQVEIGGEMVWSDATELTLSYREISNLTPLQSLINLTYLSLDGNEIRDLTPLQSLTHVTTLSLGGIKALPQQQIDALKKALPRCNIRF